MASKALTLASNRAQFVIVAMHTRSEWWGPFETLEEAQREAAMLMVAQNGYAYTICQSVGTVAKELPNVRWTETQAK